MGNVNSCQRNRSKSLDSSGLYPKDYAGGCLCFRPRRTRRKWDRDPEESSKSSPLRASCPGSFVLSEPIWRQQMMTGLSAGAQLGAAVALCVAHPHTVVLPAMAGMGALHLVHVLRFGPLTGACAGASAATFSPIAGLTLHSTSGLGHTAALVAVCGITATIPGSVLGDLVSPCAAPVAPQQPPPTSPAQASSAQAQQQQQQPQRPTNANPQLGADTTTAWSASVTQQAAVLRRILGWAAEDWRLWGGAYLSLITVSIISTTLPMSFTALVSAVASPHGNVTHALCRLSGTVVLVTGISSAQSIMFAECSTRLRVRVQKKLMANIIRQDMEFFDTTTSGDILTQIGASSSVTNVAASLVPTMMRAVVSTATAFCILSQYNVKLAAICVIAIPLEVATSHWYSNFYAQYAQKVQKINARSSTMVSEMVGSVKTVRMFAAEEQQTKKFWDSVQELITLRSRNNWILAGSGMVDVLLPHITSIVMFLYAGSLASSGALDVTQLLTVAMYQRQMTGSFESIANVYVGWGTMIGTTRKCFEYLDRCPKQVPRGNFRPSGNLSGSIELRNVSFTYSGNNASRVLHDFSLSIRPGEVVALVGPSGGGKTTVINLMLGLYDTEAGSVLIDGRPVQEYDPEWWYIHGVSVVSQDPTLFSASFKENILLGLPNDGRISQEAVESAAMKANAHEFILTSKEGYDTKIGSRGERLSGGQKQRVAIARAVVRNPAILLLDEATSALDAESEALVKEAIDRLMKGRTVVVVAHRLSTIQNADRIVVLDKGRIVQQGTHTELLAQPEGVYAQLVRRQLTLGNNSGPASPVPTVASNSANAVPMVPETGPIPASAPTSPLAA